MPTIDICPTPMEVPSLLYVYYQMGYQDGLCIPTQEFSIAGWNGSYWAGEWGPFSAEYRFTGVDPDGFRVFSYRLEFHQDSCVASYEGTVQMNCGDNLPAGTAGGHVDPDACCGGALNPQFEALLYPTSTVIPTGTPPVLPPPCSNSPPDQCCPFPDTAQGSTNPANPIPSSITQGTNIPGAIAPEAPAPSDSEGQCCNSDGSTCSSNMCSVPGGTSQFPVRYATGELIFEETDVSSNGFGFQWGHTRRFQNRLSSAETLGSGYYWQATNWPYLVIDYDGNVTVMASEAIAFVKTGSSFAPKFASVHDTLTYDDTTDTYTHTMKDGTVTTFNGANRMFSKRTMPGGQTLEVTGLYSNGFNVSQVERTDATSDTTERMVYTYGTSSGDPLLSSVTLQRKEGTGSWNNIIRATYTYYGYQEDYGVEEDLKTVTTAEWDGSDWKETGTSYYRYYGPSDGTSSSSSSSSGTSGVWTPQTHLLKYVLTPAAYARLKADPSVTDPLTASNTIVAQYADYYFEYDNQKRVTKEMVQGASQTYLFSYEQSSFSDGYNSWTYKTTETLPDGNQNIIYCNYAGQTMLKVFKSGSDEWLDFSKYDDSGRIIMHALPAAVTGYDDTEADLLVYNSMTGKYQYLRDNAGLIETYAYDTCSGYLARESVQEGQTGSSVKLAEYEYVACTGETSGGTSSSSSSSSSSSGCPSAILWLKSKVITYPSDTNQNEKIITSYSYTFYSGTCQVAQKTTTLPAIPTSQNGSGVSSSRKEYYDSYGNPSWRMDERGFITRLKYDIPTGAITQWIQDVDTSVETDAPSGWVTPSGGGLNLVIDIEHDDQGRVIQALGPSHTIDIAGIATVIRRAAWIVYDEDASQIVTRIGKGYATGTSPSYSCTLVNPVIISINSKNGKLQQQIQATRASESGKLSPNDTFAQSSYTRWTTLQYTDCCNLASQRIYHTIPDSGDGTSGTNYDETSYGYDSMKRRIRVETPGGTITRQVLDARGLTTATWMGTDDNGATSADPSGGGAPGNNMVVVTGYEYDGNTDGGNGNLTKQTQYADGTDTRATDYQYDYRNRQTVTDGEVDFYQKATYDNLNRVTKVESFNTTSTGNLIGRRETKFDDLSRIYQTIEYGVEPSTGTVGNSLTNDTWYDPTGRVMKFAPAGSKVFKKTAYDSLGRITATYEGYDLDESTYAEACNVDGDTVLEQSEITYDDASNVVESAMRQRYHDAPASQTGVLKTPAMTPKARVNYAANYPDALGRSQANAQYGTNGGTTLSRSSTIPERSDSMLITSQGYDNAGNVSTTTNPAGMVVKMEFDDVGRRTTTISNYKVSSSSSSSSSSGGTCSASLDTNVTVRTAYNADGNLSSITAENSITGDQVTQYVYGTTLSDSDVASSLLKRKEIYPDSVDSSDVILFAYNRHSQQTSATDQNGTIHSYEYDKLGRITQDRVTTIGTGVDGSVRRIAMTYEVRGMREHLTSYDHPDVGSGSVVNDVQFAYNDFGQLIRDYQAHGGSVNTSTSPRVQYGYASGLANTVRPTTMTYPNGRVLTYGYGTANGIDDCASRVASLIDDDVSSTHLVDYSYLGRGHSAASVNSPFGQGFVIVDYTQPEAKWTLAALSGSNDPDTGDIYSGLDRFARVKDNRWYDYGSSTDVERVKYGYDRVSNRTWRQNTVADGLGKHFDELYGNDAIDRLKEMARGALTAQKDGVTNKSLEECWSLDETGNWKKYLEDTNGDGTWDLNQSRTSNSVNEITEITESVGLSWTTPVYDKAGNMTTIPQPNDMTSSYVATYDAWNRLVALADGANTVSEYEYDGAKRRSVVKSYVSGSLDETRHYFFTEPSKWQVIEEQVDSSSDAERQHVWGLRYIDDLAVRDRDTTGNGTLDERLYAMQDANWNVTALANTSGTVQERFAYLPYGQSLELNADFTTYSGSDLTWSVRFTGRELDLAIGLQINRTRYLHLQLGIWVNRDTIDVTFGNMSLYEYANSRPNVAVDPSGEAGYVFWGIFVIIIIIIFFSVRSCECHMHPGDWSELSPADQKKLDGLIASMKAGLDGCAAGISDEVKRALEDCWIRGKFNPGGVQSNTGDNDGGDGTSQTRKDGTCTASVILGTNFFTKPKCKQYATLFKECYLRSYKGAFDNTGMSDNMLQEEFQKIQDCIGCAKHFGPQL